MRAIKHCLSVFIAAVALCTSVFAASSSFGDVKPGDWFYENVAYMAEHGYIVGYPNGNFGPGDVISSSQLVSIVARVRGLEKSPAQNSHWAGGVLQTALNMGWYDWDEIPPTAETYDKPITRQLAVKIIMKAFAPELRGDYNTETAKIRDFSDLDGRYYEPVIAAYSAGIVSGNDRGEFKPKSSLTRSEACALIYRAIQKLDVETPPYKPGEDEKPTVTPISGGVSENGRLQVIGTQLCNERGEPVVLRGMSSHGIQWFPQFLSKESISSTAAYGANLFRVAMYTEESGYISNREIKKTLISAIDTALSLDMYTIIDWHILSDGNPMTHLSEAKEFFAEMAERYKDSPGVIYEICNEPNGGISWSGNVKPYAEELISTIRAIDEKAVILVGSPTWSQDLHEAAKSPLDAENIMYTCHFYAGTHTSWLRDRIDSAIKQGLPVFISEWGASDASGGGGVYLDEAKVWLDFLDKRGISWANWSLCDKPESSAALKPGVNVSDGILENELTESGKFVFSRFK